MATYKKETMSKNKPEVFKTRTREWDSNEWQGRSKRQVENNEKLSGISWILLLSFLIGYGIYSLIIG